MLTPPLKPITLWSLLYFSHFNKKSLNYIMESTQSREGDAIYLLTFLGKVVEFLGSS